jgi:DNA-binding transcriptional ArsR family regulator
MTAPRKHRETPAVAIAMEPEPPTFAKELQAQSERAADMLKAIANPQRLRVLCLLVDGEKSVGEINAEVNLSQSALSQHLAVLRDKHLVVTRRESQNVYYSVAPGPVFDIILTLHTIYCPLGDGLAGAPGTSQC